MLSLIFGNDYIDFAKDRYVGKTRYSPLFQIFSSVVYVVKTRIVDQHSRYIERLRIGFFRNPYA